MVDMFDEFFITDAQFMFEEHQGKLATVVKIFFPSAFVLGTWQAVAQLFQWQGFT